MTWSIIHLPNLQTKFNNIHVLKPYGVQVKEVLKVEQTSLHQEEVD